MVVTKQLYLRLLAVVLFFLVSLALVSCSVKVKQTAAADGPLASLAERVAKIRDLCLKSGQAQSPAFLVLVAKTGRPLCEDVLQHLASLEYLDLSGRVVGQTAFAETMAILARFDNIHGLKLTGNQISELGPLRGWAGLRQLTIDHNQIKDLEPLQSLNLEVLDASHNSLSELGPLRGMKSLKSLWLGGNQLARLEDVLGLSALRHLDVHGNALAKLGDLRPLGELRWLLAHHNPVKDWESFHLPESLFALSIDGSLLAAKGDLFTRLRGISELHIGVSEDWSLSALAALRGLRVLHLSGEFQPTVLNKLVLPGSLRTLYLPRGVIDKPKIQVLFADRDFELLPAAF